MALSDVALLVAALGGYLWPQHPVFQALMLPSGGFSALALINYFFPR